MLLHNEIRQRNDFILQKQFIELIESKSYDDDAGFLNGDSFLSHEAFFSDWRKECYVRFRRRLYEENLADIYSSAYSEDSDSISLDPASILSSAIETIVIAF